MKINKTCRGFDVLFLVQNNPCTSRWGKIQNFNNLLFRTLKYQGDKKYPCLLGLGLIY